MSTLKRIESALRKTSKGTRWTVASLLVLVLAARVAAPYVVKWVINDRLSKLDGYSGSVEDVDLAIWRGAYRIEGIRIVKTGERVPVPFFRSPAIEFSVQWAAIFEGPAIVAEIDLWSPELNFVAGPDGEMAQDGGDEDWQEVLDGFVPISINRLAIHDGAVHYRDFRSTPQVNLYVQRIEATARNLSTVQDEGERLPARVDVRGVALASGVLEAHARLDPWRAEPTFDLEGSIRRLDVTELNPFLEANVGVDAEDGDFFLYTQLEARDGRFRGSVRPMVEGLSLFRLGEDGDFFDQLGDALIGLVADVFENQGEDRFGTQVPLSGTFDEPNVDGWSAVWGVLRNAFIEALRHGFEDGNWERQEA